MINSSDEYERAKAELQELEVWLDRLLHEHPVPQKGLTKAGVRKMIARLHEELAVFEGTQELGAGKP